MPKWYHLSKNYSYPSYYTIDSYLLSIHVKLEGYCEDFNEDNSNEKSDYSEVERAILTKREELKQMYNDTT